MTHVFISYSRTERSVASLLAERLTEAGYDVWWDAALLGGARFEDEINLVLREAPVAIILWSKSAATSDWVRAEAEIARERKSALPVVIDDVAINSLPILFQQIHVIDLKNWDGDPKSASYQQILKSVVGRVGQPKGPTLSAGEAQAKMAETSEEAAVWADLVQSPDLGIDDYQQYLKRYGTSARFAAIAQMRIERLERKARNRRRTVGLLSALAAVVVVGGLAVAGVQFGWFSRIVPPAGPKIATCANGGFLQSPNVTLSLCVDARVWIAGANAPGPTDLIFQTQDQRFTFNIQAGTSAPAPETALSNVLASTASLEGATGETIVLDKGTTVVDGREWHMWEYEEPMGDAHRDFLHYYYVKPGFGNISLMFWTRDDRASLKPFAAPILASVKFGD